MNKHITITILISAGLFLGYVSFVPQVSADSGNKATFSNTDADILTSAVIGNVAHIYLVDGDCQCSTQHFPAGKPVTTNKQQIAVPAPLASGGGNSGFSTMQTGLPLVAPLSLLPINSWLLFFMFANVVMMFLGGYLRLHSGRSPSFSFSFLP